MAAAQQAQTRYQHGQTTQPKTTRPHDDDGYNHDPVSDFQIPTNVHQNDKWTQYDLARPRWLCNPDHQRVMITGHQLSYRLIDDQTPVVQWLCAIVSARCGSYRIDES